MIKLLQEQFNRDGAPEEIKSYLAASFKSEEVRKFCVNWVINQSFETPYLHTSVRIVKRHLRTFQVSLETFLIEDPDFKKAVERLFMSGDLRSTALLKLRRSKNSTAVNHCVNFITS